MQVLCVNPTLLTQDEAPPGRCCRMRRRRRSRACSGFVTPTPTGSTPWVATTGEYTAQCQRRKRRQLAAGQPRRHSLTIRLNTSRNCWDRDWGLHLYDVNIALGNLVKTVAIQTQSYEFEN